MEGFRRTLFLVAVALLLHVAATAGAQEEWRSVQVKDGALRDQPSFLGKVIGGLIYGERLRVMEETPGWVRVQLPDGTEGWIHEGALTKQTIVLQAGSRKVQQTATAGEIALAGKGFNEEVEGQFRASHPGLDYAWVDRMEGFTVSPEAMQSFLTEGELNDSHLGKE